MAIRPVDTETGEVLEGRFGFIPTKKKNGFVDGWVAMSQNAMQMILQMKCSGEIDGRDLDVLLLLTTILDYENLLLVNQTDMGRKLGMKQPNVARSLKILLKKNLLIEGPKTGRSKTYRLNPNVGWKGTAKNHVKHLKLVHSAPAGDSHLERDLF